MGSLESWLLLRSLRTLHLRVPRQSESATALVAWLHQFTSVPPGQSPCLLTASSHAHHFIVFAACAGQMLDGVPGGIVVRVWHASLQEKTVFDPATQLTGGYGATFAVELATPEQAKLLPHRLDIWIVSAQSHIAL